MGSSVPVGFKFLQCLLKVCGDGFNLESKQKTGQMRYSWCAFHLAAMVTPLASGVTAAASSKPKKSSRNLVCGKIKNREVNMAGNRQTTLGGQRTIPEVWSTSR
jgi:hypothetical protein